MSNFINPITATVKWFDTHKSYGFISEPDGAVTDMLLTKVAIVADRIKLKLVVFFKTFHP